MPWRSQPKICDRTDFTPEQALGAQEKVMDVNQSSTFAW
jgi:hypothetical protein